MATPTPREAAAAALLVGDVATDTVCPAGLGAATPDQLNALVEMAHTHATLTCGGCGAPDRLGPCDGLGWLCERCSMECPCNTCADA